MNYTDLVAAKTTAGSLANWVKYTRLDTVSILEDAQNLIYQLLRVREMRKTWTFGIAAGGSSIALPTNFLDPSGKLYSPSHMTYLDGKAQSVIEAARTYEQMSEQDFGADPFTTTLNSASVAVALTAHDLTQGSVLTIAGAADVGGLVLNGGFPITSVTSDNAFVIDAQELATSAAAGGGAVATYTAAKLNTGFPTEWGVFEERMHFDVAFEEAMNFRLPCFRKPALLSTTNETNFLTTRYSNLVRTACMAAAASFNEDNEEATKHKGELAALIQVIMGNDDLSYRGFDISTDTP